MASSGLPKRRALGELGVPRSTYYRWLRRKEQQGLEDDVGGGNPPWNKLTSQEIDYVLSAAGCPPTPTPKERLPHGRVRSVRSSPRRRLGEPPGPAPTAPKPGSGATLAEAQTPSKMPLIGNGLSVTAFAEHSTHSAPPNILRPMHRLRVAPSLSTRLCSCPAGTR